MHVRSMLTAQATMGYLPACVPVNTVIMAPTTAQISEKVNSYH